MDLDSRDETPGTISLSPLALIPTGALIEEIMSRFDAVVVLAVSDEESRMDLSKSGSRYACIGMLRQAERMLADCADVVNTPAWGADGDSL